MRHLSPRGLSIVVLGLLWIPLGIGTLHGLSGKPDNAPHLHIPAEIRGIAWILTGLFAIAIGMRGKRHLHRYALAALAVMPTVRALSYSASWAMWLLGVGGSPAGYYTSAPWWAFMQSVLMASYAPTTWGYLRRIRADEERDRES